MASCGAVAGAHNVLAAFYVQMEPLLLHVNTLLGADEEHCI